MSPTSAPLFFTFCATDIVVAAVGGGDNALIITLIIQPNQLELSATIIEWQTSNQSMLNGTRNSTSWLRTRTRMEEAAMCLLEDTPRIRSLALG